MGICRICSKQVEESESLFPFPKLPKAHKYSYLCGYVHVDCIKSHPDSDDIGKELAYIYSSIYNDNSDYPIVLNQDRILVQDREPDDCVMIYNFKDFVQFHIPYSQIKQISGLKFGDVLPLGVNQLLALEVLEDEGLLVEQRKPLARTAMPSLGLEELNLLLKQVPHSQET